MNNLFSSKYPYTDFHELNLDWLLSTYQEIKDHIVDLESWMSTHKTEYEEALARLEAVEGEIYGFEQQINVEFAKLTEKFNKDFADMKAEVEKDLADTQKEIVEEFNAAIIEFQNDYYALKKSIESQIISMELEIRRLINVINSRFQTMSEDLMGYVDDRLQDFINHLPDYENLIVYNPIQGIQTNVQTAINDLYSTFAVFGLTASQYDSLMLTAQEYDFKGLTAREYDQYSYKLLGYPDPTTHMRDPFTGRIVSNIVVINELTDLHKESLTAWEYDHLELTAEEYDDMQLSAYFYDWYGIRLWDSSITAKEYDDLELSAWDYDAKRLSAIMYDNFARAFLINQ